MTDPKRRWFQVGLRDAFVATSLVAVSCAVGVAFWKGQVTAPIWIFVASFSLLSAFWSLAGRYWYVAGTVAYAALFFLLMFWLRKQALLGE